MENLGIVERVEVTGIPPHERLKRHNTFFKLKDDNIGPIAWTELDHQSGVIDTLLSIMMLLPYHDLTVKHKPILKQNGKVYKPDAGVWMRHVNTNVVSCRLVEFERTKKPNDVDRNKFQKIVSFERFENISDCPPFPDDTKVLIIYSPRGFNTFLRPMQFNDPVTDTKVNSVLHSTRTTLWDYMKQYNDPRLLLMAFPDVFWFDKEVCLTCKGEWVNLID